MRLEIDGKEADLQNNVIAITRQAIDISNLSLRNIDITNRLNLPKTNKNQEIFKSADRVETDGTGLDRVYKSKIIDQFFIFNGIGFLNEASSVYQYQLSESSKTVFANLNNKINALNWDIYDFTFNESSYTSLNPIHFNNVWVWPNIAMHEDKTEDKTAFDNSVNGLKYSRPSFLFRKILFDAIEAQGWTIELDTNIIDRICISSNAKNFFVTSYQKTLNETIDLNGSTENLTGLDSNDFENGVTTTGTTITQGTYETAYRLRGNVDLTDDLTIKFISTSNGTGKQQTKEFEVSKRQTYIDLTTSNFKPSDNDTSFTVEIQLTSNGSVTFLDTLLYTIIEENAFGDLSTNPLIGYRVKAYDNMPDKKQIDIFKDAIKITNSIIEPDSFSKTIKLKSLKEIRKLKSIDWSDKFNTDNYRVVNRISGYAQENYLRYNNDDTVSEDLGEDFFNINNEALEDVADVLKLDYGASEEVSIENNESTPVSSYNIYNDTERINEINDRINYMYSNPSGINIGRFIQLDWRMLKQEFYETWLNSFERLRIIEGEADLNKLDVIGHDFINLVYIDHFKSMFFVLIMEDFRPGVPTKVELFKIK